MNKRTKLEQSNTGASEYATATCALMARSADDVKAVRGKTGAAQSSCARGDHDAVRRRTVLAKVLPQVRVEDGRSDLRADVRTARKRKRRSAPPLMTGRWSDLRP